MKSKFKAFVLSCLPGLGHLYVGENNRGIIFLTSFLGLIFSTDFFHGYSSFGGYRNILSAAIPLIWILCQVDCYLTLQKINRFGENTEQDQLNDRDRKLIAYILSIFPGLGHLFYGEKEKGQKLISIFVIIYIIGGIAEFDLLRLGVPAIIIYSILDLININDFKKVDLNLQGKNFENMVKILGLLLIVCGIFTLGNKFVIQFVDEQIAAIIKEYSKAVISSAILIGVGVKMLMLGRPKSVSEEE